jgi:hypothetical protein
MNDGARRAQKLCNCRREHIGTIATAADDKNRTLGLGGDGRDHGRTRGIREIVGCGASALLQALGESFHRRALQELWEEVG